MFLVSTSHLQDKVAKNFTWVFIAKKYNAMQCYLKCSTLSIGFVFPVAVRGETNLAGSVIKGERNEMADRKQHRTRSSQPTALAELSLIFTGAATLPVCSTTPSFCLSEHYKLIYFFCGAGKKLNSSELELNRYF